MRTGPVFALAALLLSSAPRIAAAQDATQFNPSATVAIVNGEKITAADWLDRMQNLRAQDFIASTNPLVFKQANGAQAALEALITTRLVIQYVTKFKIMPTEAEIESDLAIMKKQPEVQADLKRKLFTEQQLREDTRAQLGFYKIATAHFSTTPEEDKAYYERHLEQYGQPEMWRLAFIRVADEETANKVKDGMGNGLTFEGLAKLYSNDGATKDNGGDVGFVSSLDRHLPEVIKAAVRKMKAGDVSDPIQLPAAAVPAGVKPPYYLVKLIDTRPSTLQPFDAVKEQVHRLALLEKAGGPANGERKLENFRKAATIVIRLPGYQDLYAKK